MSTARTPRYINFSELDRWDVKYFSGRIKSNYPLVPLATFVREHNEKVRPFNFPEETFKILGVNNTNGIFHAYDALGKEIKQPYKKVSIGDFAYNPYRFNRTNSKELVGKCAVFQSDNEYVFASYLIRVQVNPTKADPDFVVHTLNSVLGRQQIDAISRQIIGQANINSQELRSLTLPLPSLKDQHNIMKHVESGRAKIKQIKENSEQLKKETSSNIEKLILGTLSVEDL